MNIQEEIRKRKEEIQYLIAAGNVDKAIKRTMDFVTDFGSSGSFMTKLIDLNTLFSSLKSQHTANGSESKTFKTKRTDLVVDLLKLLDEVENAQ